MKKLLGFLAFMCLSLTLFANPLSIHVAEAGTLKNVIGGEIADYEKLIISGKLNGDDVDHFRTQIGERSPKRLKSINLENVTFVAGGSYSANWEQYTTEDNLLPHYLFYELGLDVYLEEVILPKNITAIGSNAFYNCEKITSISIPEGVTHIHANAFMNCESLVSVSLHSNLEKIEDQAFAYCKELSSIVLPEGLKSIGASVFQYCKKLSSITLPQSLTHIGDNAFYYCDLKTIVIPENITSLGNTIFFGCDNLVSATLPDNMTSIPDRLLLGTGIQSVQFSPNLVSIGAEAFAGSPLKTIELPETVTSIGESAFSSTYLESIVLPDKLTHIAPKTFLSSLSLESITLPKQLTSVGAKAFFYLLSLKEIHVRNAMPPQADAPIFSSDFMSSFKTCAIYVPAGARDAYKKADEWKNFYRIHEEGYTPQTLSINVATAGSLASLLGESAKTVSELKLSGSLNGTDIKLIRSIITEEYLSSLDIEDVQIVAGGESYFQSSAGVEYFTEDNVIGDNMFCSLAGLYKIVLPKGVKNIGNNSLNNCPNLISLILPAGLTSIGEYAFINNEALRTIAIPETVTEIKAGAFAESGIESITLPKNLKSIEKLTFSWMFRLKTITIPEGITSIGIEAFSVCSNLEEVNLPSSLQTIDDQAFNSCSKLKEILLPEGLTSIGERAFSSCKSLVNINIPNSVTTIGRGAFASTSSVLSVKFPKGLTRIETELFQYSALAKVTIPASVTSIGDQAFWSATSPINEIHVNNPVPPQCERATFRSDIYPTAKVYVPKGSLEAYRAAPIWQRFKNIEEEELSSIDTQLTDDETQVIGQQGEITIVAQQPAQVSVYTLTGAQVLTTRIDEGENHINLSSGMYIVKVATKAYKVIVQ